MAKCENKDKPSLHCDGKCAFKKQMAAREERNSKEPQLPDHFREIKDLQLFFEPLSLFVLPIEEQHSITALAPYRVFLPESPAGRVFRPPAV